MFSAICFQPSRAQKTLLNTVENRISTGQKDLFSVTYFLPPRTQKNSFHSTPREMAALRIPPSLNDCSVEHLISLLTHNEQFNDDKINEFQKLAKNLT